MPTYNEEKAIGKVIRDIKKNTKMYETEILIVDSSKDRTPSIARRLGAKVISQEPMGHGFALKTAIEAASGDYIITADCDDTYPMEKIPSLLDLMKKNRLDVISCNRMKKLSDKKMKRVNRISNILAAFSVRVLYGIKTNDVSTGMFCIKRDAVKKLDLKPYPALPPEMIIKSKKRGLRYLEVDIQYKERVDRSKLKFSYAAKEYIKVVFGLLFK